MNEDKTNEIAGYLRQVLLELLKNEGCWVSIIKAQSHVFAVFFANKATEFPEITQSKYGQLFPAVVEKCLADGIIERKSEEIGLLRFVEE